MTLLPLLFSALVFAAKPKAAPEPEKPKGTPIPACEKATAKHFVTTDDGWIFNPQDLLTKHHGKPDILAELTKLGAAFRRAGVPVVIVLSPHRATARPDLVGMGDGVGGVYNRAAAVQSYQDLRAKLIKAGFLVPDLMPVVEAQAKGAGYFFARDHHWTQDSAQAVAKVVAAEAKKLPGVGDWPKATVTLSPTGEVHSWPGSRGTAWQAVCTGSLPEHTVPLNKVEVVRAAADLLDGPPPPVVLVGTSNTHPRFDFAAHLVDAMGVDVINAEEGPNGGPVASLHRLLTGQTWVDSRPKLVVWEFNMAEFKPWRPDTPELATLPIYRQLVPAVDGGCDAGSAVASVDLTLDGQASLRFELPADTAVQGADHYLFVETNPKGLQGFDAVFTHAGGQTEAYTVTAYPRTPSSGRFFVQLDGAPSPLTAVELKPPAGLTGPLSMRICKVKGG